MPGAKLPKFHETSLGRLLSPVQAFVHNYGWAIVFLFIIYHYLKRMLLPYWVRYQQEKSLKECYAVDRVHAFENSLKDARQNQQVECSAVAREAQILKKAKKMEELKRKSVATKTKGNKLGGKTNTDIAQARESQQQDLDSIARIESEIINQENTHVDNELKNMDQNRSKVQSENQKQVSQILPTPNYGSNEEMNSNHDWSETRKEQDKEFEDSLSEDKIREEAKLAKERKKLEATSKLESEPSSNEKSCITIAFKLPRRCKTSRLSRRFSTSAKADQLFYFLLASDELNKIKNWHLQLGFMGSANSIYRKDGDKFLSDYGLSPRGLIIVVDDQV